MPRPDHPQSYYDDIKGKFKQARDVRLDYRPPGTEQFTSEFSGELAKYAVDPYAKAVEQRKQNVRKRKTSHQQSNCNNPFKCLFQH